MRASPPTPLRGERGVETRSPHNKNSKMASHQETVYTPLSPRRGVGGEAREDFPILQREVYGRPLVYLDNAATTQKPRQVVEAISDEYYNVNANVHRGVHFLSQQATELHEQSRETVRRFINARSASEIIFTRGTTESINLLAFSFGEAFCHAGDEIIVTEMEHHSNIVPWQMLCERKGMTLRVVPMTIHLTSKSLKPFSTNGHDSSA